MSQNLRISGSSQHPFISQDPLQDPCLRSRSIFVSQDPLHDPCLRIHVSASTNMDPLQDPRLWAHMSASLSLRLLCKIHVSGSLYKHHMYLRVLCKINVPRFMSQLPCVSQDPLQDPCLRIRLWGHDVGFMSQHLRISRSSARSLFPIHVVASGASDFVPPRMRNANFDLRRRVLCGPAQGKQSGRDPRNGNFDLQRRVLCGPAQGNKSDRVFRAGKRKFWTAEMHFFWPCAAETEFFGWSGVRTFSYNFGPTIARSFKIVHTGYLSYEIGGVRRPWCVQYWKSYKTVAPLPQYLCFIYGNFIKPKGQWRGNGSMPQTFFEGKGQ